MRIFFFSSISPDISDMQLQWQILGQRIQKGSGLRTARKRVEVDSVTFVLCKSEKMITLLFVETSAMIFDVERARGLQSNDVAYAGVERN